MVQEGREEIGQPQTPGSGESLLAASIFQESGFGVVVDSTFVFCLPNLWLADVVPVPETPTRAPQVILHPVTSNPM